MKTLIISSYVTPEIAGYADKYTILDDLGNMQRHGVCSACPNPYQPKTGRPWQSVYGWLAPISCIGQILNTTSRGICCILNNGWYLPARLPNSNHGGKSIVNEILVHCGDTEIHRGSAACLTLPPSGWKQFIDCFDINELILFKLIDCTGMRGQDGEKTTTECQDQANTEDKVS